MMRKIIFSLLFMVLGHGLLIAQLPQLGKSSIDEVMRAMTLEEKIALLVGGEMGGQSSSIGAVGITQNLVPGAAGTTHAIPRLGIPSIVFADGPAGVRIQPVREGDEQTYYCTAFPIASLLSSTWNIDLVTEVGKAMGNEAKEYGVDVLLAPALNIQRDPLCGRNFEYYSEDPLLSGLMASAIVRGIQSNGVGTSPKHFAANNQETNRMATNSIIDERTLREIYLKGFEIVVKEAKPWTVMSSYNYINGVFASENRWLLTDVLRNEWGFQGAVVTDWFGGKNASKQVHAGNDLLMPGRSYQYDAILKTVKSGTLSMTDININVKRMLQLIESSLRFKNYAYSNKPNLKEHGQISRYAATEGMVLLENKENTLPFSKQLKTVAAFGTTSYDFIAGGTGAGDVNEAYTVSLVEGLQNAGYKLDADIIDWYRNYMEEAKRNIKSMGDNPHLVYFNHPRIPESIPQDKVLERSSANADLAIITIGRNAGEYVDRQVKDDFELTKEEKMLIKNVCDIFHRKGKKVVVILNVCGVVETASWKNLPDAILLAWQAGQEGGNAVADILKGAVSPSGKLPVTFPVDYYDVPSSDNFPYDYQADPEKIISTILIYRELNSDRRNVDYTEYSEGIFMGYRYFDTYGKPVSYPFGYGLSYTQFEIMNSSVKESGDGYLISFDIKNIGTVAGKEVVQLYVEAPRYVLAKPFKELKAFAKTALLKPGESQTVTVRLKKSDLASYNPHSREWVVEQGQYRLHIGNAVNHISCVNELFIP